jgi:LmbE family N-acetylglucosaminyl deacetylase
MEIGVVVKREFCAFLWMLLSILAPAGAGAQDSKPVTLPSPDDRFKADILVFVGHPDDEAAATTYLARALDEGKRVGVVFGTRGGSGRNTAGTEHAAALADIRELEARRACATLGINNVWFLGGKDTASQNVLQSLASWGHGAALEEAVRLVRLTRPEVILTYLPGVFIGENHGDHQAVGVIATEAFDMAAAPAVFPAQVAGATRRLEPFLEGLRPWQPKKLYYYHDGGHEDLFKGTGPEYSVRDIAKSRKWPYWRLAVEAFRAHETQAKGFLDSLAKMSEAEIEKMATSSRWTDKQRFVFGKSLVGGSVTGDIFEGISSAAIGPEKRAASETPAPGGFVFQLAGPWDFYDMFRPAHGLSGLPQASPPEIAVQERTTLYIPLHIRNGLGSAKEITLSLEMPANWKSTSEMRYQLRDNEDAEIRLDIDLPAIASAEENAREEHDVIVRAEAAGQKLGELKLHIQLRKRALPQ